MAWTAFIVAVCAKVVETVKKIMHTIVNFKKIVEFIVNIDLTNEDEAEVAKSR